MISNGNKRNVLDLRGLLKSESEIIDRSGKSWPIVADLPLSTATVLLSYADDLNSGEMTLESFNAAVDGLTNLLKLGTPDVTRQEVIEGFTVTEMISIITFVSFQLQAQSKEETVPVVELLDSPHDLDLMEQTQKPRKYSRKSTLVN